MRIASSLLAIAATLALAACAERAEEATANTESTASLSEENATDMGVGDQAAATDAQGFVNAAAASDKFEIESGKLAQQKGTSQAIKDFGAMLERDHTKSTADLKAAAGEVGMTPAPEMTAKQKSDLAALEGADGNFDQLFKTQQVAAHEQALALLRAQAQNGTAAPLKAFAERTAPVVEGHLIEARELP